jgi:hypothetical protein
MYRKACLGLLLLFLLGGCAAISRPKPDQTPSGQAQSPGRPEGNAQSTDVVPKIVPPSAQELLRLAQSTTPLVPLSEIKSGGPPPDGIPAIDQPLWITPSEAAREVAPLEPVISLVIDGDERAYPLAVMTWHEIVNDHVGGRPVTVTFCPLCNTALVFERVVDGKITTFGTSGFLYKSDLVMYDRESLSLWSQIEGRALAGPMVGVDLAIVPASIVAFSEWATAFPEGKVLSRDTGHVRRYGTNPYVGYDRIDEPPFLFDGELDGRLPPMERVVAVTLDGESRAYPFRELEKHRVIQEEFNGQPLVLFWQPGTTSALDASDISQSRDVGATGLFDSTIDGKQLRFEWSGTVLRDKETGSAWNIFGRATQGELAGKQLRPIVSVDSFWFSWAAFRPETSVYSAR